jgi:predicted Rossmann fold nucleotide-binding protein DprA/Smf involved in DNA uptake
MLELKAKSIGQMPLFLLIIVFLLGLIQSREARCKNIIAQGRSLVKAEKEVKNLVAFVESADLADLQKEDTISLLKQKIQRIHLNSQEAYEYCQKHKVVPAEGDLVSDIDVEQQCSEVHSKKVLAMQLLELATELNKQNLNDETKLEIIRKGLMNRAKMYSLLQSEDWFK